MNALSVQSKSNFHFNITSSWDDFGQLKSVQVGTLQISDILDGLGRRIGKRGVNERSWIYRNRLHLIGELGSDRRPRSYFLYGTKEHVPDYMVMIATNEKYKLVHDQLGSVRMVVNASTGAVAQRIQYDEFGKVLSDTNPGFQPFGYAGGLYDPDTGLMRFGAREYDPELGRWLSKDPILFEGGDTNLYSYCKQDPINCIDSDGRESKTINYVIDRTGDLILEVLSFFGNENAEATLNNRKRFYELSDTLAPVEILLDQDKGQCPIPTSRDDRTPEPFFMFRGMDTAESGRIF